MTLSRIKPAFLTIAVVLFAFNAAAQCHAQDVPKEGFEKYEARLNAVLMTRRTVEKEYVAKIVKGVKDGEIPLNLVDQAWIWVRDKRPNTQYPFVYFARVLKLRGDQIKVKIPEFDFSIYSERNNGNKR